MGLLGIARKTHWVGVAFLFISSVFLLITTISAPLINDVGLLRVTLTNETHIRHSSVSFGTFGYCILDVPPVTTQQDYCTKRHIGYDPADIMAQVDSASFSEIAAGTSDSLTRVMVLHPIVCGLAFIAFLCAMGSGIIGSLIGAMFAFVAWVLTLVVLATDFSLFGIVRHHVNNDKSGSHAYFGVGIWLLLAAFVLLFFGMVLVFFTCAAHRREKKRGVATSKNEGYPNMAAGSGAAPVRRKRFGLF